MYSTNIPPQYKEASSLVSCQESHNGRHWAHVLVAADLTLYMYVTG